MYDDFEKVVKLSVYNKLIWLCGVVKFLRNNLNYLNMILKNDMDSVFVENNLLEFC